ncbi:calcium-transporting ATPase 12, plasma membrane-type-like [Actinidia eriantha]|uniref:calcium-transporting ATPase 12, plasma membrane-type-like n=1 Tax=Actinidia eriantha TaxID=165200 RepID=UPI002586F17F|nr:calcium-transporting ATPase 12, plasma membrane-type-like [Actinidia eriantha]
MSSDPSSSASHCCDGSETDPKDDSETSKSKELSIRAITVGITFSVRLANKAKKSKCRKLWKLSISVILATVSKKSSPSYVPLRASTPTSPSPSHVLIDIPEENEKDKISQIVRDKNLNALIQFGGVQRVASLLGSNLETGLVNRIHDPNNSTQNKSDYTRQFWNFFVKACKSCTVFLLLISGILSLVTEILVEGSKEGWKDGATILTAVFLLVTLPAGADIYRAWKQEEEMRKKEAKVEVVRNGKSKTVPVSCIVLGDLVNLEEGNRVPADGLLVDGDGLMLNDTLASNIDCEHNPFLLSHDEVLRGNGRMIVTSVGTDTAIEKVISMGKDDTKTLLQSQIDRPGCSVDIFALCVSILITLVLFIRFLLKSLSHYDNGVPELKGNVPTEKLMKVFLRSRGLVCILTAALNTVVLGLQHGMSLAITVSLSYWNQKVASDHAIPQNLSACGAMGLTTVICIDLSDGLSCKDIEVEKFWVGENEINTEQESDISQVLEPLWQGISISVYVPKDLWCTSDGSLCSWAQERWGDRVEVEVGGTRKMIFNTKGRGILMRTIRDGESIMHLHWRGSAQTILNMCSHYYDCGGRIHALESQKYEFFEKLIKGMEDRGLSPIAFTFNKTDVEEIVENELNLLAIVGFKFRKETKNAIESLKKAGVNIKLVTGYEIGKAKAIASELGIYMPGSNNVALEGEDFYERITSNSRVELENIVVVGRCLPDNKLLMIQSLKNEGHIVAFCGGSTTGDAAALKEADLGITGEIQSIEAREISDFIITSDGGLFSLTLMTKHGRRVYHNIQKFMELQLTACVSGILITAVWTMSLGESPITAIQLIWVNLIVSTLGGIMMVMELPTQGLMAPPHPPKPTRTKSVMTMVIWRNCLTQVLYQAFVLLIFQFEGQAIHGLNQDVIKTMVFNTFVLCQVFNMFNVMELEKKENLVVFFRSYCLLVSVGAVLAVQVLLVQLATSLATYVRLNWVQWAFCLLFSALSWGFDRALKFICVVLSIRSVQSNGLHLLFSSARAAWVYVPPIGVMFSMFVIYSFSQSFKSAKAWTLDYEVEPLWKR